MLLNSLTSFTNCYWTPHSTSPKFVSTICSRVQVFKDKLHDLPSPPLPSLGFPRQCWTTLASTSQCRTSVVTGTMVMVEEKRIPRITKLKPTMRSWSLMVRSPMLNLIMISNVRGFTRETTTPTKGNNQRLPSRWSSQPFPKGLAAIDGRRVGPFNCIYGLQNPVIPSKTTNSLRRRS